MAASLREHGYLPGSTSIWAVENPLVSPVERLQRKAEAGAEVVLTQPLLLGEHGARWVEEAHRLHITDHVKASARWQGGRAHVA